MRKGTHGKNHGELRLLTNATLELYVFCLFPVWVSLCFPVLEQLVDDLLLFFSL